MVFSKDDRVASVPGKQWDRTNMSIDHVPAKESPPKRARQRDFAFMCAHTAFSSKLPRHGLEQQRNGVSYEGA